MLDADKSQLTFYRRIYEETINRNNVYRLYEFGWWVCTGSLYRYTIPTEGEKPVKTEVVYYGLLKKLTGLEASRKIGTDTVVSIKLNKSENDLSVLKDILEYIKTTP